MPWSKVQESIHLENESRLQLAEKGDNAAFDSEEIKFGFCADAVNLQNDLSIAQAVSRAKERSQIWEFHLKELPLALILVQTEYSKRACQESLPQRTSLTVRKAERNIQGV